MSHVLVIGAGPAGLMAAQTAAEAGCQVTLCETMPTVGRKFLMAGKSGLNITKAEPLDDFLAAFDDHVAPLSPMLQAFDNTSVQQWARDLGQEIFTGSSGRVFPKAMKASVLLRAWMQRLADLGVTVRTRWHWIGLNGRTARFDTPQGPQEIAAEAIVLACGGASWSRLGSDGRWKDALPTVEMRPFAPANAGVAVPWSVHMAPLFGQPIKSVSWTSGRFRSRGEAVITEAGLEGGGIYSVSRGVRSGEALHVDLCPDLTVDEVAERLRRPRGKTSTSNFLRKTLRLDRVKLGLLLEMGRPLPQATDALAHLVKALPLRSAEMMPLDGAISVAGGVAWTALDPALMLREVPGVFAAGEMLEWEAPTGGYLISGCLATGRWAGRHAATYALKAPSQP